MKPLAEKFVEQTWQQIAGFPPERATKEMHAMGKSQPDILALLLAYTDDLQQEVKELGIYIAFVVYKMFHDSAGKIPKISSREIMSTYDENSLFWEGLKGTHEKMFNRLAKVTGSKQPYVMKYVLKALIEDAGEEGINLTVKDIGFLFILLKTEMEVLDKRT